MSTLVLNHNWNNLFLVEKLHAVLAQLQNWSDRRHQRKQLASLDPLQLRDIGLTREQVNAEIAKPFWK